MSLQLIQAARVLRFNPENGWPETFTTTQAIGLQTWQEGIENKEWIRKSGDLKGLLALSMKNDSIQVTTTTERVQTQAPMRRTINPGFASREWEERGFGSAQVERRSFLGGTIATAYTQPAQYKDVTRHYITAEAFAAWLAANDIEPSRHVTAWFKVLGVSSASVPTTPEPKAAQPAPVVAENIDSAPTVPFRKSALIAAHRLEWPTIERDISDAHNNGLADLAKAGKRGWLENEALKWARAKGKLISAAKPDDSLAQVMHSMSTLPSRKHKMQG